MFCEGPLLADVAQCVTCSIHREYCVSFSMSRLFTRIDRKFEINVCYVLTSSPAATPTNGFGLDVRLPVLRVSAEVSPLYVAGLFRCR